MGNDYKIGDHVKIKEWDDMAKEYGTRSSFCRDDELVICVPHSFTSNMKNTCGLCAKIIQISLSKTQDVVYELEFYNKKINRPSLYGIGYSYSEEMFTKITEEEFKEEMKDSISSQIIELLEKIKK